MSEQFKKKNTKTQKNLSTTRRRRDGDTRRRWVVRVEVHVQYNGFMAAGTAGLDDPRRRTGTQRSLRHWARAEKRFGRRDDRFHRYRRDDNTGGRVQTAFVAARRRAWADTTAAEQWKTRGRRSSTRRVDLTDEYKKKKNPRLLTVGISFDEDNLRTGVRAGRQDGPLDGVNGLPKTERRNDDDDGG